jgi:ribulose 1,5-bisphosphate synthetase/thiazole synthase
VRAGRASNLKMAHKFDAAAAGRKMRVAVVGGGPSGACAAEIFAQVLLAAMMLLQQAQLTHMEEH